MKIAFVYGDWSVGNRPFNMGKLWSDPRGLTGSEVSFFSIAKEMRLRGHKVSIFTQFTDVGTAEWEGCRMFQTGILNPSLDFDAVCSWNEPDQLRRASERAVRSINQQLNDFDYCAPGFDDFVDVYTSPSHPHRDFIRGKTASSDKWEVLSNGCRLSDYSGSKVKGRVIYASSPDRGLHLLLQEWPRIKRAVPYAQLRIFYNFEPWIKRLAGETNSLNPDIKELAYRALYIREAIDRLKNFGVEHHHSISRNQMAVEMSEAEILAYPCDTIRYTEGFSVTLMEACASGTLPITSSVDSLGGIYGEAVPMIEAPVKDRMKEFGDLVIRGLTDRSWRESTVKKTKKFASGYQWAGLAETFESILKSRQK